MLHSKVIIVGGGPAGAACGWKLNQHGIECLILDQQPFPRPKLCAGWITPQVLTDLEITLQDPPPGLMRFHQFQIHLYGKTFPIKVRQYAIRRLEFDYWLLKRAGVAVHTHAVREIKKTGDFYSLDDRYRCQYLIGAGGVHCPVYRTFFGPKNPRAKNLLIITLEEEFPYDYADANCHLWFAQNKLPGYAWYVPKNEGYLNIGIGGYAEKLKAHQDHIKTHWQLLIKELARHSLVKNHAFQPRGYAYYLRNRVDPKPMDNLWLIGDAAGLATRDMGEGIGPAVKSGLLAAESLITGAPFSWRSVKKYSFPRLPTALKLLVRYFISRRPQTG